MAAPLAGDARSLVGEFGGSLVGDEMRALEDCQVLLVPQI